MPTQTWTLKIDGPNIAPLQSFAQVLNALKTSSGQVTTGLQGTEREIAAVGAAASQHGPALVSFFQNALSAATGFLAANVIQNILSGLTGIGQGAIQAAASMEQTRAGFTTILGSAQQANALIAQLQREANVSPFTLDSFRQGAQLLLGMGTAADQIVPRLHNVSNVVAALGGGPAQFDRILAQLAQIDARGKAQGEDLKTLAENAVPVWAILADFLHTTTGHVQELATAGKITADTWDAAFAKFANSSQIASAAEAQSHTFNGLLSTIQDIGSALGVAFGGPLLTAVEPTLERIVSALQSPQVVATLQQWGAAAGAFVNGLIQAGQTAFQVGGLIIAGLKPAIDAISQLFGIQGPALQLPTPPDFGPSAAGAGLLGANLGTAAGNARDLDGEIAALQGRIANIRDTQAAYDAGQERALTGIRNQQAVYDAGAENRIAGLRDQARLLDQAYQSEKSRRELATLGGDIAKDRALAGDVISSQGQAAAKRLKEELARQADLQDQAGHDQTKNALANQEAALSNQKRVTDQGYQAQVRGIEAAKQLQDQYFAGLTRGYERQIRLLQDLKKEADVPPPTPGGSGGGKGRVTGDDITDRYSKGLADVAAQAPNWGQQIKQALDGVLLKIGELTGDKGLGGLQQAWDLWTQGLREAPAILSGVGDALGTFGQAIDVVAGALGIKQGLANSLEEAKASVRLFFLAWESYLPAFSTMIGGVIRNAVDGFKTLADGALLTARVIDQISKGNFDITSSKAVMDQFGALVKQVGQDQRDLQGLGSAFTSAFAQGTQRYQAGAANIARDFAQTQAGQGLYKLPAPTPTVGPTGTSGGQYSPQYQLPPQGSSDHVSVTVNGHITVDQNGVARYVQGQITGKKLAKNLGDLAASGY